MANSPFAINMIADVQRIEEDHEVRVEEQAQKERMVTLGQHRAKQEIIMRALEEEADISALRREKRAIMEEEKRLRALMGLEKANNHRKADRMAAQRAESQRHLAKKMYRVNGNLSVVSEIKEKELSILRERHAPR